MTADSEIATSFRIPKRCQRITFALSGPGFTLVIRPKSYRTIILRQSVLDAKSFHAEIPSPKNAEQIIQAWLTVSVDHLRKLCRKK